MRNGTVKNIIVNSISIGCAAFLGWLLATTQVSHWQEVRYVEPIKYPTQEVEIIVEDTVVLEQETGPSEADLMAAVVMGEAGNQPFIGKVAVAQTIINRSRYYGMTIQEVIEAPNQYTHYTGEVTEDCYRAVEYAEEHGAEIFPADMMFFRAGQFHKFGEEYVVIGDHYFSRR